MTKIADVDRHRDVCTACSPSTLCDRGQALLTRATDEIAGRLVPDLPVEVIDLPAHVASCPACKRRLCPVGQRIADDRATALLEVGARSSGSVN